MLDAATDRFIAQVSVLPADSLADAFDRAVSLRRAGGREASRATKPSASENSELQHAVRDALLPRADELNAHREGLHSDAKSAAVTAARAILKRRTLSAEQYGIQVEPFVRVGVDVPSPADQDTPGRHT